MKPTYLEFEKSIESLEARIISLKKANDEHPSLDITRELKQLEEKSDKSLHEIYDNLTAWQISQVARHPQRQYRNFGMPRPEGYRKALRLFKLAEKFSIPIITLIDTPGAYPGIGAEERGQSEAIARNLYVMSELKTPIIGIVIGEGGSGGALALGVVDSLLMLQYSTYSVISPEGCASILWKKTEMSEVAAETLGITAGILKKLTLADQIIQEPLGGAHRDIKLTMSNVKYALKKELSKFKKEPIDSLLKNRYQRLMNFGHTSESEK